MKFDFSFLTRIYRMPSGSWSAICAPALAVVRDASSRSAAASQVADALRDYVDAEAVEYIKAHAGDSTRLRCPEGTVNLLADDWFCKHTGRRCPIGAVLDRADIRASLSRCDAPEKVKKGIPAALTDGYAGLHHTNGRYLCPLCGSREKTRYRASSYRYPFELQQLPDILELTRGDRRRGDVRRQLVLNHIDPHVMSHATCARCLRTVIESIDPVLAADLEVVNLSIEL